MSPRAKRGVSAPYARDSSLSFVQDRPFGMTSTRQRFGGAQRITAFSKRHQLDSATPKRKALPYWQGSHR